MVHTFKGLVLIEPNKLMYELKDVDVTDTAVRTIFVLIAHHYNFLT